VNVRHLSMAARLLVATGGCASICACVGNPFVDAKVDPRSPIAREVATSVRSDAPYPTFRGIPPVPKDVRPHRQYGVAAAQIEKEREALVAETGDQSWTLQNTETFAAQARSEAGPERPPGQPGDTTAFAKDQKARATAPPARPR
jgi:hypothetical protein